MSLVCKMSSGCKDLCTFFTIWDTDRVLYNCQHPTIFGTSAIFHSTVFLISLSLVSKLKLNTRVLKYSKYSPKYSSTPWCTQILEYSTWYCLKYLYIEYFLAVKGLGSLKFLVFHTNIVRTCCILFKESRYNMASDDVMILYNHCQRICL